MYPDQGVTQLIVDEFIPVRAHIKEQPTMWPRFNTRWTPTVLVLDPRGREQHRLEGYLPVDEFLAHLYHGLGLVAVALKDFGLAEKRFRHAVDKYPDTEIAPAALYWTGVARPIVSGLIDSICQTCERMKLWGERGEEPRYLVEVTALATTLAMNFLTRGRFET